MESNHAAVGMHVALLNQGGELDSGLRDALRGLGADIVYEADAKRLDRAALAASGARVVVVNLGADAEQLEEIHDLFDAGDYAIVINDTETTAQLNAAEQARWVRLLAGKILQRPDFSLPPRPLGAEPVPATGALRAPPLESAADPLPAASALTTMDERGADFVETAPDPIATAPTDSDLALALESFDSAAAVAPAASTETLQDFDRMFAAFDMSDASAAAAGASAAQIKAAEDSAPATLHSAPASVPDWSLAPLLEDEPAAATEKPRPANEFGIETIPAQTFLTPPVEAGPGEGHIGLALDAFDFDLVPLESAAEHDPVARELADALRERARVRAGAQAADPPSGSDPPNKPPRK